MLRLERIGPFCRWYTVDRISRTCRTQTSGLSRDKADWCADFITDKLTAHPITSIAVARELPDRRRDSFNLFVTVRLSGFCIQDDSPHNVCG